ncbi:MAG: protoheme IX farnesyltransferase [Ignavibacteriaceae bacterium]|nr:protoheme IX farnesyltransferase [Ignavibacteriaceae bacterium]
MATATIKITGSKRVTGFSERINTVTELMKLRITTFVTLTTIFGFICYAGKITMDIIAPAIGILLLSSGSAVINHYQERFTDALMKRTHNRPIPSGKISAGNALALALILVLSGSAVLFIGSGLAALCIGLLNLFWYNGIYTPLKRKSALAIIPGSLVGALPPMVGWAAAGGSILDPQILILGFFFFIWQIPHFWLLLLIFGKDYEQAGFPTLTQIFSMRQLSRITFIWIASTFAASTLLPMFGLVKNYIIYSGIIAAGIWLLWNALRLLKPANENMWFRLAFREINIFAILVVLLLSIEKLFI